ncbi:dienelactone hydrolase [Catalinimonas alkaloidigena]|uniref:alpha/beta hydrolase n=1 Tax=Catalinimonas alkaloidigena TaxID=1075417 RepID=UPI002406826B|nr:alpha/beta fold hydrolase [Catalinimonas alkaloidigena]MDF9798909.1 dienelactone hydrolase [Catalinimonas alkaloidigena]
MFIFIVCSWEFLPAVAQEASQSTLERREEYLRQLKSVLPPDSQRRSDAPPPTPVDSTWSSWQQRSGELPPDFTQLPSLPFLPDPLILDEGGENIPVKTMEQWYKKRQWIKEQAQHWITGTMPPAPDKLKASLLHERTLGALTEKEVLLEFGPDHQARLHISLLIPPGEKSFPVFLCPWKENRYDWVQAAVRRGYMAVRFRATDPKYGYPDDSEAYEEIWWPDYDFSTINRWAWAVSRTIDYLYSLPKVNKEQIALTGLSRNGKMSLWAAAYDERIKAVVPISGGTGGENPFRYTSDKYDNETIELLSRWQPHWLHPRIRFFVGREHKLPVDQNSLMALIAPRGLMLSSSITESQGGPWGIEQAYTSAQKAYEFLGAADKIALDLRHGLHAPSARDMERYLDFFDYIFGWGSIVPNNQQYYNYSFSRWLGLSEELIDPLAYESKGIDNILVNQKGKKIRSVPEWEQKEKEVEHWLDWAMGDEPPSIGPGKQSDYMREVVGLPNIPTGFGSQAISFGRLYFPLTEDGKSAQKDLPLVIYLHEYSYAKGFVKSTDIIKQFLDAGFAVYAFDQIGFGSRIEEGRLFYERFPHWSKLGRMVSDVRWAIDELSQLEFLDKDKMVVAGYSLGATVGLYTAAKDDRIAGVISVSGFSPLRLNRTGKTAEGILWLFPFARTVAAIRFLCGK